MTSPLRKPAHGLLVPTRPGGPPKGGRVALAVLATPFTAAADVLLSPLELFVTLQMASVK